LKLEINKSQTLSIGFPEKLRTVIFNDEPVPLLFPKHRFLLTIQRTDKDFLLNDIRLLVGNSSVPPLPNTHLGYVCLDREVYGSNIHDIIFQSINLFWTTRFSDLENSEDYLPLSRWLKLSKKGRFSLNDFKPISLNNVFSPPYQNITLDEVEGLFK